MITTILASIAAYIIGRLHERIKYKNWQKWLDIRKQRRKNKIDDCFLE